MTQDERAQLVAMVRAALRRMDVDRAACEPDEDDVPALTAREIAEMRVDWNED